MSVMTLGERIKAAREKAGLSQSDLAVAIGVNSANVISNWENNANKPDPDKLVQLCKALKISASFILDYYADDLVLSFEEDGLIKDFRKLNTLSQQSVLDMVEEMLTHQENHSNYSPTVANSNDIIIPKQAFLLKSDPDYAAMRARSKGLKKLMTDNYLDVDSITKFLWRLGYGDKICRGYIIGLMNGWRVPAPETYEHIKAFIMGEYEVVFPQK